MPINILDNNTGNSLSLLVYLGILILEINIVDHQFGTTATLNDENNLLDTLEYNDFVSVLDHS